MQKNKNKKQHIIFLISIFLGTFALSGFAFGQSCPSITTVTGTSVNFVGEITDMGGDSTVNGWFEYGKTSAFGQTSPQRTLSQLGIYCVTVSGLDPCTTYYYRAVAENSVGRSYGEVKTFNTSCGVTVDLKANGSDGPIQVSYGNQVNLSWTSSNADSCYASGDWSRSKSLSGSQTIYNLTSSKTFTLNCTGPTGSVSDSVKVNVTAEVPAEFSIYKTVRNLSDETAFLKSVSADPGEVLIFRIKVKAGNNPVSDLIVKDTLPSGIIYVGDLRVDDVLTPGNILTGLNIGNLSVGQEKIITFRAGVLGPESFVFGQTELTNTVLASSNIVSRSDTAKIVVSKTAVAGAVTKIPTGLTNNIFLDSLFLPLIISLSLIWLFKSRILRFEEWLDARKKEYQKYCSDKTLRLKISKIKTEEFLKKKYRRSA